MKFIYPAVFRKNEEGKYKDLFLNYSGYLWEYISKEERNFNRRYYSTYKKNEFDGYLSEEDVSNIIKNMF